MSTHFWYVMGMTCTQYELWLSFKKWLQIIHLSCCMAINFQSLCPLQFNIEYRMKIHYTPLVSYQRKHYGVLYMTEGDQRRGRLVALKWLILCHVNNGHISRWFIIDVIKTGHMGPKGKLGVFEICFVQTSFKIWHLPRRQLDVDFNPNTLQYLIYTG